MQNIILRLKNIPILYEKNQQQKITEKKKIWNPVSVLIQCLAITPVVSKRFLSWTFKPLPTVLRIDATKVLCAYSFLPDIKIFLAQSWNQ